MREGDSKMLSPPREDTNQKEPSRSTRPDGALAPDVSPQHREQRCPRAAWAARRGWCLSPQLGQTAHPLRTGREHTERQRARWPRPQSLPGHEQPRAAEAPRGRPRREK